MLTIRLECSHNTMCFIAKSVVSLPTCFSDPTLQGKVEGTPSAVNTLLSAWNA